MKNGNLPNTVYDSSAILEYFFSQSKEADKVARSIKETIKNGGGLFVSAVNWGEILYVTEEKLGKEKRDIANRWISEISVCIEPADREIADQAASLKLHYGLHYADCFAASLALSKKAVLCTRDRDFLRVKSLVSVFLI